MFEALIPRADRRRSFPLTRRHEVVSVYDSHVPHGVEAETDTRDPEESSLPLMVLVYVFPETFHPLVDSKRTHRGIRCR